MRRLTALICAATLAVGGLLLAGPPATAGPNIDPSLGSIAIVPLDDRPFPSYTPVKIAEAGGHRALTPYTALLGEFFTPGDADAIGDWWQQAAGTADASVVSISMLAYGGLVASRTCSTPLSVAEHRLERLRAVKAAHPDRPLYAFDVIQRLTIEPTSGYPGGYSGPIRNWAILMDKVENLGMEELRGEYEAVAASIPEELRTDYLCARARNHAINLEMIELADEGVIDYLILGQDDASEFGPHRAEKIQLAADVAARHLQDRVKIYPGADTVGALLVGKVVIERLGGTPSVSVDWSRTPGDQWTAPYQDIPYADLVHNYIATLGGQQSAADESDVKLMANTGGGGSLLPFVDKITAAVARGDLVAIGDDAFAGKVDAELSALLAPRIQFGDLAAWSGWNVGVSLSESMVRSALLTASRSRSPLPGLPQNQGIPVAQAQLLVLRKAATAHEELLLQELVHTDVYRNQVLASVQAFAVANGDDPQYMTKVFSQANQLAVDTIKPLAQALYHNEFDGRSIRIGATRGEEYSAVLTGDPQWQFQLAWPRYQELEAFPTLSMSTDERDRPTLMTVTVDPYATTVRPETASTHTVTTVLRNDSARPVDVTLSAAAPAGWSVGLPPALRLQPWEVRQVPVDITVVGLAAEATDAVAIRAEHRAPGGSLLTTTASATFTARWRNVAAAAEGASATASDWWQQYRPEFTIDGNRVSSPSRWITEVGAEHWLQVDFAGAAPVDTVELFQYGGYLLTDYRLLAQVDGAWVPVADVRGNESTAPVLRFDPVTATGLRLEITGTRDGRARLYELEATCRAAQGCEAS